jgi:hypothetical protein
VSSQATMTLEMPITAPIERSIPADDEGLADRDDRPERGLAQQIRQIVRREKRDEAASAVLTPSYPIRNGSCTTRPAITPSLRNFTSLSSLSKPMSLIRS